MFGIGTSEILIILLIALLILGPKEIPKVARTIGRGMRELQRAKDDISKSIEFEMNEEEYGSHSKKSDESHETQETTEDKSENEETKQV